MGIGLHFGMFYSIEKLIGYSCNAKQIPKTQIGGTILCASLQGKPSTQLLGA